MRKSSSVILSLLIGTTFSSVGLTCFAGEFNNVIKEKLLAGQSRYESAIEVSKSGWSYSDNVVLVNGAALPDALAATPYARMKDAPILLTERDKLTTSTEAELIRLGTKNVTIIGGEGVVSKNVENKLKDIGITISRIAGKDRFETSMKVARNLSVNSVAIVNGLNGRMADAMSIAAPAAERGMAILLTDGNDLKGGEQFLKDNLINNIYAIGGEGVISKNIVSRVNAKRIGGVNRFETNASVLETFYQNSTLGNIYTAKSGIENEGNLVDALSAGALASKEGAPVMLIGKELSQGQKDFLNGKQVKSITKVGYGVYSSTIEQMKEKLNAVKGIEVHSIEQLKKELLTAEEGELIRFNSWGIENGNFNIETNRNLTIELNGKFTGKIIVNMPNGNIVNNGELANEIIIDEINNEEFINNGKIKSLTINDKSGATIFNEIHWKTDKITVGRSAKVKITGNVTDIIIEGKDSQLKINRLSEINKVQIKEPAQGAFLENEGTIKNVTVDKKAQYVMIENTNGRINYFYGDQNCVIGGRVNIGSGVTNNDNENNKYTVEIIPLYDDIKVDKADVIIERFGDVIEPEDDGTYSLKKGSYTYKVRKYGFEEANGSFGVNGDRKVYVDLKKEGEKPTEPEKPVEIKKIVKFKAANGKESLDGSSIVVKNQDKTFESENDGSYKLEKGSYSYVIKKEGFKEFKGEFQISDSDKNIEVALEKEEIQKPDESKETKKTVNFKAKDGSESLNGASIVVKKDNIEIKCESDGSYKLENGIYIYIVKKDGFKELKDEFKIDDNDKIIEVSLEKEKIEKPDIIKYVISGTVSCENEVVKDAEIILKKDGNIIENIKSNIKGEFTAKPIEEGNYVLEVTSNGYKKKLLNLKVSSNLKNVDINLEKEVENELEQIKKNAIVSVQDGALMGTTAIVIELTNVKDPSMYEVSVKGIKLDYNKKMKRFGGFINESITKKEIIKYIEISLK